MTPEQIFAYQAHIDGMTLEKKLNELIAIIHEAWTDEWERKSLEMVNRRMNKSKK